MPAAKCPECDENIHIEAESEQGSLINCDECGENLEIVGLDPFELDPHSVDDQNEYGDGFNIFENDA